MEAHFQVIKVVTTLIQPYIEITVIMILHEYRLELNVILAVQSPYSDHVSRNGELAFLIGIRKISQVGLIAEIHSQHIIIVIHATYHGFDQREVIDIIGCGRATE